ncbi:MAG: histone deacetylase [Myxococcales bacterium]|nr:histone deacetylase [Polyangiaceae bacterium]MDW8251170.1 histone deacetylase [Myxococcales bacterium]
MRLVFSENLFSLQLPHGHRFPIGKYRRIYDLLAPRHGRLFQFAGRASLDDLRLIHDPSYIDSIEEASLEPQLARRLGFPLSPELADRSRRSVGGTLTALAWAIAHGAAGHLAGGTHHGFRNRGEGYCVYNDIAVAAAVARRDHGIQRIAIIDLDVHQGNGTAAIFAGDSDIFTLSIHGERNYPFRKEASSLDIGLPDGCEDLTYLRALDKALELIEAFRPELIFYQAGVDVLAGDTLGRLALTLEGTRRRNRRVYDLARRLGVPIVVTLGGGYHREIDRSIAAHVAVYEDLIDAFPERS